MTRNLYTVPNPDGSDPAAFVNIHIETAPDNAGSPGLFSDIATVTIDSKEESTDYLDATGTLTTWYRHRYSTAADALFGDYSSAMQFGDYVPRQWIKAEIKDADLSDNKLWDQWRDQVFQELSNEGLGRVAAPQDVTPTDSKVELYDLNAEIRRVLKVEVYTTAGWYVGPYMNWHQWGRKLRILHPRTAQTYKVWGTAELRGFNDIDDELFTIIKWGMRMYYCDYRRIQRIDLRPALSRTRLSDTTSNADFGALFRDAQAQFLSRIDKAKLAQAVSYGSRG